MKEKARYEQAKQKERKSQNPYKVWQEHVGLRFAAIYFVMVEKMSDQRWGRAGGRGGGGWRRVDKDVKPLV